MKRKASLAAAVIALCATLSAGWIVASNMGFKVNYPLYAAGSHGSRSGVQDMGLPYFPAEGLTDAFSLMQDIEGGGPPFSKVVSISKFRTTTDSLQTYTGRMGSPGANFPLVPGECYRIQMLADVNYILAGFHDPTLAVPLYAVGAAGSKSGTNTYTPPYNLVPTTSLQLMLDIEGRSAPPFSMIISVSKFLTTSDSLQVYTDRMGSPGANFTLVPGACYRIQTSVSTSYLASHY